MSYAFATLWHERQRYLPGVLAVGFSALLIALQCGLLVGLFSITSIPVDHTNADVWLGSPDVLSVDLGGPIPESYLCQLAALPEVKSCEVYMQGFAKWKKPNGGEELCMVMGSRLGPDALGAADLLTPEMRAQLTEPGAIILDRSEFERLGIEKVGDKGEINGHSVRVVNTVSGIKSLGGPYLFSSVETARRNLRLPPGQTMYILAKCYDPQDAPLVVSKLKERYEKIAGVASVPAFTKADFSYKTRMHWLTKTRAGIALGCAAALGLLVGAVVVSQTLYAATAASLREYAVLQALGIPRWRMGLSVLAQSFWIGVFGVALSIPTVYLLKAGGEYAGAKIILHRDIFVLAVSVTMTMALVSGLAALRSLKMVEPATLLR